MTPHQRYHFRSSFRHDHVSVRVDSALTFCEHLFCFVFVSVSPHFHATSPNTCVNNEPFLTITANHIISDYVAMQRDRLASDCVPTHIDGSASVVPYKMLKSSIYFVDDNDARPLDLDYVDIPSMQRVLDMFVRNIHGHAVRAVVEDRGMGILLYGQGLPTYFTSHASWKKHAFDSEPFCFDYSLDASDVHYDAFLVDAREMFAAGKGIHPLHDWVVEQERKQKRQRMHQELSYLLTRTKCGVDTAAQLHGHIIDAMRPVLKNSIVCAFCGQRPNWSSSDANDVPLWNLLSRTALHTSDLEVINQETPVAENGMYVECPTCSFSHQRGRATYVLWTVPFPRRTCQPCLSAAVPDHVNTIVEWMVFPPCEITKLVWDHSKKRRFDCDRASAALSCTNNPFSR